MEPDSVDHLSTIKSQKELDVNPLILLLALECKVRQNGESEIKAKNTYEAGLSKENDTVSIENKRKEKLTKEFETNKTADLQQVDSQIGYGEQVTDQVGLSSLYNNTSSSTYSLNNSTLCKPMNRISTHRKITCERLRELKILVDKAIKENKTFTIQGCCPSVRNALRQRGWIEKRWNETRCTSSLHSSSKRTRKIRSTNEVTLVRSSSRTTCYSASVIHGGDVSDTALTNRSYRDISLEEEEDNVMSRMLRNAEPALVWTSRSDSVEWSLMPKHQMVNRFPRTYFATKVGLCGYLQQMHWFYEAGISDTLFPRCYCVCLPDEMQAFRDDFRLTACLSLLKWLVSRYEMPKDLSDHGDGIRHSEPLGVNAVQSSSGKVPLSAIEFAIQRVTEHIISSQHGDIDLPMSYVSSHKNSTYKTWDHQWDQFLTWFYQIVHEGKLLSCDSVNDTCEKPTAADNTDKEPLTVNDLYTRAKSCLNDIRPYWPQIDLDGMMDLWILKPGAKSRGRGIQLVNRLESVNQRLSPAVMKETRYVIQKYIERPLLIHKTKFDIRQWFLVTNSYPLTIWMYKESYLRFSSQIFSLHKLHESIHLCNNAIQCRYTNGNDRDPALPEENMWDCYTFQTYLRTIGHANVWEDCIYPGMKEGIIGALLASQDNMTDGGIATNATASFIRGKGSISHNSKNGNRIGSYFELFGADFMLTEDYRPWLIEINSCPCMAASTSVTARMCPQCLEDVVKVVVDRRVRKEADTGMFELVYKQHVEPPPPYTGVCLSVHGKQVQKSSKNEVAASGGLEPGDKHQPDGWGGVTEEQQHRECYIESSKTVFSHSKDSTKEDKLDMIEILEEINEEEGIKDEENLIIEENNNECKTSDSLEHLLSNVIHDTFKASKTLGEKGIDCQNVEKSIDNSFKLENLIENHIEKFLATSKMSNDESGNSSVNVSIDIRDEHDVLNSIKLFQEWRKSLVYTRETCKGVLNQLKLFREWHMHSSEEFRERSQAVEHNKHHKSKLSDKVPLKNKLRWKKALHKNSLDMYNVGINNKHSLNGCKLKNMETLTSTEMLGKRFSGDVGAKSSHEQHKNIPFSKFKHGLKIKTKKSNPHVSDFTFKEGCESGKNYWSSIANFNPKILGSFAKNFVEDESKSESKSIDRQKSFLDHITVLNRKRECRNCLVSSNCDVLKKKAGFRPIEVVTFDPPFL